MAHRSFFASRTVALSIVAVALGALAGCTAHVTGGGGTGDSGNGASGTGGSQGSGLSSCGGPGGTTCDPTQAGIEHQCPLAGDPQGTFSGTETCEVDGNGNWAWTTCAVPDPPPSSGSTPLVLSFDGAPVDFVAGTQAFDLAGAMSVVTDWPTAATPWLALDRNGNGSIDDGGELFGSATVLRTGERASNGFIALAELDSNGDGRITPEDAAWSSLRLWSDADGDRASGPGELTSLGARRILSIDLGYTSERRCDTRGNCEIERASFRWADESGAEHTGTIVDVHLRHQSTH